VTDSLFGEQVGVLPCCEADHLQAIGVCFDDSESALTDRAGGTENGDASHSEKRRRRFQVYFRNT
jgi:hypothetical protein